MDEAESSGADETAAYSGDNCNRISGKQLLFGLPFPIAAFADDVVGSG
jgi:hypothetical protein